MDTQKDKTCSKWDGWRETSKQGATQAIAMAIALLSTLVFVGWDACENMEICTLAVSPPFRLGEHTWKSEYYS